MCAPRPERFRCNELVFIEFMKYNIILLPPWRWSGMDDGSHHHPRVWSSVLWKKKNRSRRVARTGNGCCLWHNNIISSGIRIYRRVWFLSRHRANDEATHTPDENLFTGAIYRVIRLTGKTFFISKKVLTFFNFFFQYI